MWGVAGLLCEADAVSNAMGVSRHLKLLAWDCPRDEGSFIDPASAPMALQEDSWACYRKNRPCKQELDPLHTGPSLQARAGSVQL